MNSRRVIEQEAKGKIHANLRSIKNSIKKENVSWAELSYLQEHQKDVLRTGDIELAQWAGISESQWNKYHNR